MKELYYKKLNEYWTMRHELVDDINEAISDTSDIVLHALKEADMLTQEKHKLVVEFIQDYMEILNEIKEIDSKIIDIQDIIEVVTEDDNLYKAVTEDIITATKALKHLDEKFSKTIDYTDGELEYYKEIYCR